MGAEKIGLYSYSYSIATYFGLFILLGLNNYGNRTIASVGIESKDKLSKTFWSIYIMQLVMSVLVISIYIFYTVCLAPDKIMAWIQIIYLFSVCLDINWFFFGIEQFKLTVIRNTIIKILNVFFILMFVKSEKDIYLYSLIMVIGMLISQITLWIYLKKYIVFIKVNLDDVRNHIMQNFILFIPVIAISLYTIMDRVMLGIMSNMSEVGFYESAAKLTNIPTSIVTSIGTVMLPRISNMIANGKSDETLVYIRKSLNISVILSSTMSFGLAAISKEFVPLFYGNGFEKCIYLVPFLVSTSIFISWANVIRTQYLIPYKKDKVYIISVFLGAIVNVLINFILIPKFKSFGAVIGTVIAEFVVCLYQTYTVRNELRIIESIKENAPYFFGAILMYALIFNISINSNFILTLIIKILVGIFIYIICLLFILKKKNLFNKWRQV